MIISDGFNHFIARISCGVEYITLSFYFPQNPIEGAPISSRKYSMFHIHDPIPRGVGKPRGQASARQRILTLSPFMIARLRLAIRESSRSQGLQVKIMGM